jgi:hypothetical protein
MAIASAIAAGVSLKDDRFAFQLDVLKRQLIAKDLPSVATLLAQAVQVSERDVPRALLILNQIVRLLAGAVDAANRAAKIVSSVTPIPRRSSLTSTLSPAPTPVSGDDLATLRRSLARLQQVLVSKQRVSPPALALSRVCVTLDQRVALVAAPQLVVPPPTLLRR